MQAKHTFRNGGFDTPAEFDRRVIGAMVGYVTSARADNVRVGANESYWWSEEAHPLTAQSKSRE